MSNLFAQEAVILIAKSRYTKEISRAYRKGFFNGALVTGGALYLAGKHKAEREERKAFKESREKVSETVFDFNKYFGVK